MTSDEYAEWCKLQTELNEAVKRKIDDGTFGDPVWLRKILEAETMDHVKAGTWPDYLRKAITAINQAIRAPLGDHTPTPEEIELKERWDNVRPARGYTLSLVGLAPDPTVMEAYEGVQADLKRRQEENEPEITQVGQTTHLLFRRRKREEKNGLTINQGIA